MSQVVEGFARWKLAEFCSGVALGMSNRRTTRWSAKVESVYESQKKRPHTFRFQLRPRIEDDGRAIRILISRPGENGEMRIFEFDHNLGDSEVKGRQLLDIDILIDELKQLSPAIRGKVEQTLRRVEIPKVRVKVQSSQ